MRGRAALRIFVRWLLTILMLAGVAAHLYSARRCVDWTEPESRFGAGLSPGSLYYWWRPPGWKLSEDPFAASPGWSVTPYGDSPSVRWWTDVYQAKSYHGVAIPVWMPVLPVAVLAALAWFRDRACVRARWRKWLVWLTPTRPKRMGFWLVAGFCVVHVVALMACVWSFDILYGFFFYHRRDDPVYAALERIAPLLLWSTPAWALLWAWLYVRTLNALLRRRPGVHCAACGYDLTGNVSGRCPECGCATKSLGKEECEVGP